MKKIKQVYAIWDVENREIVDNCWHDTPEQAMKSLFELVEDEGTAYLGGDFRILAMNSTDHIEIEEPTPLPSYILTVNGKEWKPK